MPLPLLIGGALIAGIWGAKKGVDAYNDYDLADTYNKEAEETYKKATETLNKQRKKANSVLEALGEVKYELATKHFDSFHQTWKQLTDNYPEAVKEFLGSSHNTQQNKFTEETLKSIESSQIQSSELISGGVAALGSGGMAGLAAYGGVGMLGTASTGTAIGSLSGVAATNATLAWLGGGSIASGGLGMAGGAAVLGGIVAGPVLAIGGMIIASKAETAKEEARENIAKANLAAKEMKLAGVQVKAIHKSSSVIQNVILELLPDFLNSITSTSNKINSNDNIDSIRESAMVMLSYFEVLYQIYNSKTLTENGSADKSVVKSALAAPKQISDIISERLV